MPYVINRNFSRFYDMKTETDFAPQLDLTGGCYVAVASVDEKKAGEFEGREGFEVLDADQYVALTVTPPAPPPTEPTTGSALTDQAQSAGPDTAGAQASATSGPPPPPESK